MEIAEYPKFTIIMRGYTTAQADIIMQAMAGFESFFGVEVTMNTANALEIIEEGNKRYGDKIKIGAGTVMNIEDEKAAINKGAKFLLGPQAFTKEMIDYAHQHNVIAVPAAMTPTEIVDMLRIGADIVKIFPASTVRPDYFKAVQAPLGKQRLMAVGGVSAKNAAEFIEMGTGYLGMGSSLFNKEDLNSLNVAGLAASLQAFVDIAKSEGGKEA